MSSICVAFCLLTSAVAFLISSMMSRETLATFTIPAMRNEWDMQQKSSACRNAGFMYLFIALALTAKGFYSNPQTRSERAASYATSYSAREAAPLVLGSGGQLSDSEETTTPMVEGGIPTGRERTAYGSVEMSVVRRHT